MDALAQPHWEAVVPKTRELLLALAQIPEAQPFYLAGGTALALQLGHRISQDLDLFAALETFEDESRRQITLALERDFPVAVLQNSPLGLVLDVQGLAVGLFTYGYPLLAPTHFAQGIQVAGLLDIGLMKLDAIAGRGTRRDFYDIYFIAELIPFRDLFARSAEKYANDRAFKMRVLTALVDFDNAERQEEPLLLAPVTWEEVKTFCIAQAQSLGKQWFEE